MTGVNGAINAVKHAVGVCTWCVLANIKPVAISPLLLRTPRINVTLSSVATAYTRECTAHQTCSARPLAPYPIQSFHIMWHVKQQSVFCPISHPALDQPIQMELPSGFLEVGKRSARIRSLNAVLRVANEVGSTRIVQG